jgi:UDP-glucose 4-epimerase
MELLEIARIEVEITPDSSRYRASDRPRVVGRNDKLSAHTGWKPRFAVRDGLLNALRYWQQEVREEALE